MLWRVILPGFFCRSFVSDLVVIGVKNGSIFSKIKRMVAFYFLAVTLPSPFIFLLRLAHEISFSAVDAGFVDG
jgi:hypothetical protein